MGGGAGPLVPGLVVVAIYPADGNTRCWAGSAARGASLHPLWQRKLYLHGLRGIPATAGSGAGGVPASGEPDQRVKESWAALRRRFVGQIRRLQLKGQP